MADFIFDMDYDNINIITNDSIKCDNCVKNFTDAVSAEENKNVNDHIVNTFLEFKKNHMVNINLILDNEVKSKLLSK
ncbi:hypothetical protein AMV203 [Betaentomopoxvirus amoorei]|uniref:AMV203 n=1 Tax=Amsacta moorei entomopoxvirus TaxID=28321 RepID=Q9EMK3_AMEPV|nr:hypothetical protein AMV203 [Amsacta moorei entomopoxvirus]AAG02909.1 AMV203 [Amsacta moorei entomopoxvirus]